MENSERVDNRNDNLNDSWVELYFQHMKEASLDNSTVASDGASGTHSPNLSQPVSLQTAVGQMEKLLQDAARESSRSSGSSRNTSSVTSSRASPKSPHSPNNEVNAEEEVFAKIEEGQVMEQIKGSDWIWDWSSRPEAQPPSDYNGKFVHCKNERKLKLSVRNTKVMKNGIFCLENLPTLLLTHATTFLLGAALMFVYLKKKMSSTTTPTFSTQTFNF